MTEEPVVEEQPVQEEEDWKGKYLRALADQENMRKRIQREKQEMIGFGIENATAEFLPAIDNLENALKFGAMASGEIRNWASGFEMILSQFKEVLHNHGIVSFHSEGNTFDPEFHDAVEIVETSEYPDGAILHEFAKGYKNAHRTIRPARVKVAKRPQPVEKTQPECAEQE
ncbi:MAG: nucleotide exchange factor GrpE [Chlamydiae bacterium RIFCSPHIGHO2_12_FULL_44_59]|nr:MAG: nucleotide exchange factor GrpE [Chlamydiae bacterium RIFCSPHIGHO2_01_FULL_44_39]OGN58196.1 MAG: nucleotide exchange factor GrpE [Chlamydiae bacterium RIFCSPHIGHO2_02_FULL_45_9]OGN60928.1 MAG: nucleotide exchange factor GrpE [Chlamydiae bacterium RIFCSPHIGHO2_12_FULL_44_59]OGN66528.1 MAG: nucleotide exchange factor GrpE [Chlamydiae bacterium RIFCSPLOWO2_01_FULL_44_52]OGN69571.1 MAG: nucleotide exchange factor GrpE [Chlamydiae bacterium RIFCSPLOWO2_02_FULL_45_22]OGN70846.1 MAG: nucleoti